MKTTGIDTDWQYDYADHKFILQIDPATRSLNFRESCVHRARDLANTLRNPVLSLSGGLDSQIVLHSFYEQDIKLDCVFRHFPGYNDNELENISVLQKKYNFHLTAVEVDTDKLKDSILDEYQESGIPPNQLLYKYFCSKLPDDLDIIQGLDGPNIYRHSKDHQLYYMESYNSFEFARRRAMDQLDRKGKYVSFEKNSNMLLSTLNEETMVTFLNTYDYFFNNQVEGVKVIDLWDVYIKPYIYFKHWQHELVYFPKYQGPEGIEWIIDGPKHEYTKRMISIEVGALIQHLTSGSKSQQFVSN